MEHPENNPEYAGLQVNSGVEQQSIINPYLKRNRFRRRELSAAEMVEGIIKGDVTILSQAVTLIESVNPDHQAKAQEVINKCLPYSGNSIRVGISGVPGAGKSTSIDEFGIHVLREKGGKLAVLAIDPSSERSKGSILGDKTRMEKLAQHPASFIRPSPSAGSLGGVARKTRETIILCEAAGFDKIFVETVGVGQSETACHSMVDFFLLIQLAGTGDDLQGIKRGIMEICDGIVINKCDGDNVDKCHMAATNFRNALHFFPTPDSGWLPKVLCYSGFYGLGIKEVWDSRRLPATPWSTSSCCSRWQVRATSCKASSAVSWRSVTASSSTSATATLSTSVRWPPRTSATPYTSSPCQRVVGCRRCCAIAASMAQVSRRCGT